MQRCVASHVGRVKRRTATQEQRRDADVAVARCDLKRRVVEARVKHVRFGTAIQQKRAHSYMAGKRGEVQGRQAA